MIIREHYIRQIRPFYDSDLIKVITGIRRCGKSIILSQIADELKAQGKQTLTINFEMIEYADAIPDAQALVNYIHLHMPENRKLYIFLDEIQLVKGWNIACRSLRLENISLFITLFAIFFNFLHDLATRKLPNDRNHHYHEDEHRASGIALLAMRRYTSSSVSGNGRA